MIFIYLCQLQKMEEPRGESANQGIPGKRSLKWKQRCSPYAKADAYK